MSDPKYAYYTGVYGKNGGYTAWCSDKEIVGYDPISEDPTASVHFSSGISEEAATKRAMDSFEQEHGRTYWTWCEPAHQRLLNFKDRLRLTNRVHFAHTKWWSPPWVDNVYTMVEGVILGCICLIMLALTPILTVLYYMAVPFIPIYHAIVWSSKKQEIIYRIINRKRLK